MSEVREYVPWDDERAAGLVRIVDDAATKRQMQNRVITKEEYRKLFPQRPLARMTFIRFAYTVPRYVGKAMAKVLLRKYVSLRLVDGDLRETGDGRGDTWQALMVRCDELKLALGERGIALPKVGRSREEKEEFVKKAEELLCSSEK